MPTYEYRYTGVTPLREDDALPATSATTLRDSHEDGLGAALPGTFQKVQRFTRAEGTEGSGSAQDSDPSGAGGGVAIYAEVITQIKGLLRDGQFRPGDRLPSERELAETLGVNRNALREAIRALTVMGVIQTRPQSGSFLSTSVEGMLRLPFEFMMLMLRPSYAQIHELRSLIELYAAERAAVMRTPADLAHLETLLSELRQTDGVITSGAWNIRFHRAVAAATRNLLIEHVLNCLLEARSRYLRTNRLVPGGRESVTTHERIIEAIRRRDPAAARVAMQEDMATATRIGERIAPTQG